MKNIHMSPLKRLRRAILIPLVMPLFYLATASGFGWRYFGWRWPRVNIVILVLAALLLSIPSAAEEKRSLVDRIAAALCEAERTDCNSDWRCPSSGAWSMCIPALTDEPLRWQAYRPRAKAMLEADKAASDRREYFDGIPSRSKETWLIEAELYSVDGYQGWIRVPPHTGYIAWDGHFYLRDGITNRFIQRDDVARIDKLLPEPRDRSR